ncbi:uncharacterized protein akap12a [Halichoeres trimaculatus]|uniref:uncharacterized protein akap12a n=1 Tax=Halichoeres trimaculatus TaxID=147232 RepID=UPI003D9E6917
MGDAQSAQREGKKDEAAEEESGKVDGARTEQCTEDKPFINNVQICEINEKAGISIAGVNGLCEDEVAADAILSPDEDISETDIPLEEEEEAPKVVERNGKESSNEVDVPEDAPVEMTEMDGKKNDINDGFRKFFSNIGLRLSIKRGSTDLLKDLPDETNKEEQYDEEPVEVVVKETESEIPDQNNEANTAQGTHDNDSTTGPTMTDLTPEDVLANAEEKATEAKEDAGSDDTGEPTPPEGEQTNQEATPGEELQDSPDQAEVVSPIKKFFTTGIFSGLRKKRKPVEEETNEKEMIDMGKKDSVEVTGETEEDQQQDKDQIDPGVEASADETEHKENEQKQEILSTTSPETTDEGKSSTTDPSTDIVPDPDTLNAHEKERVPSSPLRRLLSGSSFRKLSKKPRSRRSSDSRLSDSGEHAADQLMSSTESAEIQKEEGPTHPSSEATGEEDGAWASFKKLLTPKKRRRAPSPSNKEADTAAADKSKPSEGEQISDQSTDEEKKRKDSSVSWEAVLCGSGKKRSRKTSDSEDETPPNDKNDDKQDDSSKPSAGLPQERSSERKSSLVSSTRVRSDGEGPTTWITFRRLVTPKRKAKEEDENKDSVQSDSEVSQEESSFSIKKLLPGRKKRKSPEKQDHVSSDEADKDVPSGDEDSETPAVVPLSEFDTPESMVQIQTQAEIESHLLKESDNEVPEDLHQSPEPVLPCEGVQNEGQTLEESEAEKPVTTPAKDEELDDDSEVISKHQQLSDITEEGIITETMATPASVNEEAGRDDTIAEDLMEMTSEAITAPEPASVTTLADETEMISAVSQLSTESSKTSGNTTPVPAEYEVMETDALLHQVVETITTAPEAVPIGSSNTKSENIVSSVLHQIFKTFVKEDKATAVLEIHARSEAAAITTGDAVKELDEVKELAATVQTESIPEVNDSEPTEFLPEALEKFEIAEITVDEVNKIHPTQPELCESEASAEHVLEETAPGVGPIDEAPQDEIEGDSLELREETEPQNEVQVEPEKVDEPDMDAAKAEHAVQDTSLSVHASKLDSDVESEQLPEQEVESEDILPAERTMDEVFMDAREITQSVDESSAPLALSEGTTEQVDATKTEDLAPPTEESLEPVDSFTAEPTGEPEDLQTEQTTPFSIEEPQQEMEISNEPENKQIEDTAEDEQIKEPEVLEAVQAPVISLEDGRVQSPTEEVKLEDAPVADELEEESIHPTEDSFELLDATKAEHIQETEVFDTVASPASFTDNLPLSEEERLEAMPLSESVIDEGQRETEASVQPDEEQELEELPSEVVDTGIETSTEDFFVSVDEGNVLLLTSQVTPEQTDDSKTEDVQEQELQTLQPPPIDSQISDLTLKEEITKDIPATVVTDEPQKETEVRVSEQEKLEDGGSLAENVEVADVLLSEVEDTSVDRDIAASTVESLEPMASFTAEQVEEPEELQTVQTSLSNTEELQQEVKSVNEDVEIVNIQEPEVLPTVVEDVAEETALEKEDAVPIHEITESIEEISATVPPTEGRLEPLDLSTTDVQVQEEPQTEQALPLSLKADKLLPLGEIAEDISAEETTMEELQKEIEVMADAEKTEVEADTTDSAQEPEDLPSAERDIVQETVCEEDVAMLGTEATDSSKGQRAPTTPNEPSPEPVNVSEAEDEQEGKVLDTEEVSPLDSEEGSLSKFETKTSEVITTVDEPQIETEDRGEEPAVSPSDVEDSVKEVSVELLEQPQVDDIQEVEVLQSVIEEAVEETLMEKDSSVPVLEPTESIDVDSGTVPVTEGSLESVDLSTTEQIQVQEEPGPVETIEASSLDSDVCSLPLARLKTEDITAPETVTDELKPTTEVKVEADTNEFNEEPEEPPPTPEDTDQETSNERDTTQAATVESIDGDIGIISFTEQSPELVDVARTENKQEPEEVNVEQQQESDSEATSLRPFENVMSEEIPVGETVTDEPQKETEVMSEPEREPPGEVTEQGGILISVKDTSAEEGATIQELVLIESTNEVFETTPNTNQSPEPVEVSGTGDVQGPEVLNAAQGLPQDSTEEELPLDKVKPEDKSAVETTTDELQKETDFRVEPQKILLVEADTSGTEQEAQLDLKTSVATVESVTNEPQKDIKETIEPVDELPTEASKSEIQEPEELPSCVEDLGRESYNTEGTTTDIFVAAESIIEHSAEVPVPEESFELVDVLKTEQVQVQGEMSTVEVSPLDSKVESLLPLEKELQEDKPAVETVVEELQKEICVSIEPQDQQSVEAETSEAVQEPDALLSSVKDTQETQTKEEATIHMPGAEKGLDEGKTTTPPTEESTEPVDASGMEDVQEPKILNTTQELLLDSEVGNLLPLEKVESEEVPAVETVTQEEIEVENEEPEVLPSAVEDAVKDSMTEEGICIDVDEVTEGPEPGSEAMPVAEESLESGDALVPLPDESFEPQIEKMSSEDIQTVETVTDELTLEAEASAEPLEEQQFEVAQTENDQEAGVESSDGEGNVKETKTEDGGVEKLEEQISQDDVSRQDLEDAVAAFTDHIESKVAAQLDPAVDVSEGHETESNQQDVQVCSPEVAEELATKTEDHVASVDEESNHAQVIENTMISEETHAPNADDAVIIDESKHEVPLSAVYVALEEEKESEDPSTGTATLEHAIAPEVVTCFLKEVSATIQDALPETTSDSAEPVLDSNDFAEAAEQDSVAQMMHAPSVECADDGKIQVQVVDTNTKSMETIVDEMPEVEITELKEVVEVHHETVEEEDNLSAPLATEEGEIQEKLQTTTEEVVHAKENLPEVVSELADAIAEQAVETQPDAVDEVCELTESKTDQEKQQEVMDDVSGTMKEKEDEAPVVIIEDPATSVSGDAKQTKMLDETKAEEVESATSVTVGEVKPLSEESDVCEPEQRTQSAEGPVATVSDTGLVVPQNTGIISSTGNFETPSSLSFEFKLNIQFGQAKIQPPQSPTTGRAEPVKKKDVSEVGVQAEVQLEPVEPTTPSQQVENQKNTDLAVVNDQLTDAAESVTTLASTARAVITTHPVQMNLGALPIETATTTPVSPPLTTERDEPEMDVSGITAQAVESEEPETLNADSQKQTEMTEVREQQREGGEPGLLQDLTEKATTEPEILDVATDAAEPVEQVSKQPASPPPEEGTDTLVEQLDAFHVEVDAGELIEPVKSIKLPQEDNKSQIQTEQTDANDQPTEAQETLELMERAVITTQPELMNDSIRTSETEEPVAEEKGSTQVTLFYEEARAVIITQPVLWDLAIRTVETVEPAPKGSASPEPISTIVEALAEDVSKDEVVESFDQKTQIAESQTELTEADDQAEPEEPSSSAGAVTMTHPMLLDISLQESETERPAAEAPSSPLPITGEIEPMRLADVSEVGDKDVEAVEAAEPSDETQGAGNQIEPVVVDVQPTEIPELETPLDSTEGALIVTQPELLDAAIHAIETPELEPEAPASPSAVMESAEALTPTEVSNKGVQDVEVEELRVPTRTAEEQKEIKTLEVDILESKITEREDHESAPEIKERVVITTHPTLLEVGIHTTETVGPAASAPDSPTVTSDETEPLKQMDVLGSDIQAEEADSTQEAESHERSELPEISLQDEPEVYFDLTQTAVMISQPVLLDDGLYTTKTVEVEEEEEEDKEINPVEKVTSSIPSTETTQPVCPTEKEEAFDQDSKVTKEHVQNPEEENDQDVWLDAEEGDYTQEETDTTFLEVEEHLESVAESMLEEEATFEEEVEKDQDVPTEEEESHQKEYKTGEVCEIESEGEGEDFAIALEHQEYGTASVSTIEWD